MLVGKLVEEKETYSVSVAGELTGLSHDRDRLKSDTGTMQPNTTYNLEMR